MSRFFIAFAAVLSLACSCLGQESVTVDGVERGKSYVVTIGLDGSVAARPTLLGTVGGTPTPQPGPQPQPDPTDPQPPPPTLSPFAKQISLEATAVINAGGSPTTAAGLSEVYGRIGEHVGSGAITPPENSLNVSAMAVAQIMLAADDRAAWQAFRDGLTATFAELQQKGELATKEQYAATLADVSAGLAHAAGYKPTVRLRVIQEDTSEPFIGGIDITKVIEFINIIIALLKSLGILK